MSHILVYMQWATSQSVHQTHQLTHTHSHSPLLRVLCVDSTFNPPSKPPAVTRGHRTQSETHHTTPQLFCMRSLTSFRPGSRILLKYIHLGAAWGKLDAQLSRSAILNTYHAPCYPVYLYLMYMRAMCCSV